MPNVFYRKYRGVDCITKIPSFISLIQGETASINALAASDIALVCCGTATLEAAYTQTPFAAFYRAKPLTHLIGELVLKTPYLALPNIIQRSRIVPELIQNNFTKNHLVYVCQKLLSEPNIATAQVIEFKKIKKALGKPGAHKRVTEMILEVIE